jgi:hypothetical protein
MVLALPDPMTSRQDGANAQPHKPVGGTSQPAFVAQTTVSGLEYWLV